MSYYTLIAYKPESEDTCRGCLMESYSSEFIYEHRLTKEEVLEKLTDIEYQNLRLAHGETGYIEIEVLYNGVDVDDTEDDEISVNRDVFLDEDSIDLRVRSQTQARERKQQTDRAAEQKKKQQLRDKEVSVQKSEIATLTRLRDKYPTV